VRRHRVPTAGEAPPATPDDAPPLLEERLQLVPDEHPEARREAGRDDVEIPVPSPCEPTVAHGDHLLVRMIERREQHRSCPGAGDQHADHRG
jgi:hypothetical protein